VCSRLFPRARVKKPEGAELSYQQHHQRRQPQTTHFLPAPAADVPRSPPPVSARGRHCPRPQRVPSSPSSPPLPPPPRTFYNMHSSDNKLPPSSNQRGDDAFALVLALAVRAPRLFALSTRAALGLDARRPPSPSSPCLAPSRSRSLSLHTRPLAFRVPGQSSTAVARAHQSAPPRSQRASSSRTVAVAVVALAAALSFALALAQHAPPSPSVLPGTGTGSCTR